MEKETAMKALKAGAINTSCQARWIDYDEKCILPQFINKVKPADTSISIKELRELLITDQVVVDYFPETEKGRNSIETVFDYRAKEFEFPGGKKGYLPKGVNIPPYKNKKDLDILASHMPTKEWKQLIYLVAGIGEYTKLQDQGDNRIDKYTKEKKQDTKKVIEKKTTEKQVVKKETKVKSIKNNPERIKYSSYTSKHSKKKKAKASVHKLMIELHKTKTATLKKENRLRKSIPLSIKNTPIKGKILNPDKQWCISLKKSKKVQGKKRIKPITFPKHKNPDSKFTPSARTTLKIRVVEDKFLRNKKKLPLLKRHWRNYNSSPHLLSEFYSYIRLNYTDYKDKTDTELFQLRCKGKLTSISKQLNAKFGTHFNTNIPKEKVKEVKKIKETKGYSLTCISKGDTVYRLPYLTCMDIIEKDGKFKFVPKTEWKQARLKQNVSYTYTFVDDTSKKEVAKEAIRFPLPKS